MKKMRTSAWIAVVTTIWFAETTQISAAQIPEYTIVDLGTLGGDWSEAHGINVHGQVVGYSRTQSERKHAFLYSNGIMQDLGTLDGESSSYATGINNRGEVVGYSETRIGDGRAFFYANGIMRDLGKLVVNSYAYGINNLGQVVGDFRTQSGDNRNFLYFSPDASVKDLGKLADSVNGINDKGQIVGSFVSSQSDFLHPLLYSSLDDSVKDLGTLVGMDGAKGLGINNKGEVVGYSFGRGINGFSSYRAFLYSEGIMHNIGTLEEKDSYAYAINNLGQVVGAVQWWGNFGREGRAFLYSNGIMVYLHDLIDIESGWRLYEATAINDRGQIVGRGRNASNERRAFLLNPITRGWQSVIESQPIQPTYSEPPKKEAVKNSLVVVTHGWQPAWNPVDISWVGAMTNTISQFLISQGLTDWQGHAYRWVEKARPAASFLVGGAKIALQNGKAEGIILGRNIANQGFDHVHLIAHSAGAGLIQATSETIKEMRPDIVVHLTFLDAFVGFKNEERENYGKGANWADNYFSRDTNTGGEFYQLTEGPLVHAYNVDVTLLDTNKESIQVYSSTLLGEVSQTCYQTVTSHGWPYQFYTGTILPNAVSDSKGFGFPLSREGGNWNFATNGYRAGASTMETLGSGEMFCTSNPSRTQLHTELPLDFSKLPGASVIINAPEKVIIRGVDFTLKTSSPAWLASTISITNKVNLVSFEAVFTSANASEGLLSVYWETNVVGSLDERVTLSGMHKYSFPIPETATNGVRALGFRLDAFSAIQSSVIITNVALGFAGVKEPFSLSFAGINANGMPLLELIGPSGFNYAVETSTNLVGWTTVALLVNTNGVVRFVDTSTNNATARFYRAVAH